MQEIPQQAEKRIRLSRHVSLSGFDNPALIWLKEPLLSTVYCHPLAVVAD